MLWLTLNSLFYRNHRKYFSLKVRNWGNNLSVAVYWGSFIKINQESSDSVARCVVHRIVPTSTHMCCFRMSQNLSNNHSVIDSKWSKSVSQLIGSHSISDLLNHDNTLALM